MSRICAVIVVINLLLLLLGSCAAQAEEWYEDPAYVNKFVTDVQSPVISPGKSGTLSFNLTNPTEFELTNVSVCAEPYVLVYPDGRSAWEGIDSPPVLENSESGGEEFHTEQIKEDEVLMLDWTVETSKNTEHGGLFSQAVYFVRLKISFEGNGTLVSYASRGHFSETQWNNIYSYDGENNSIILDTEYLNESGYQGLIPDLSFIVKKDIPVWPMALIFFFCGLAITIGIYYHIQINPSSRPRLYQAFEEIRSKLQKLWRPFQNRWRKS